MHGLPEIKAIVRGELCTLKQLSAKYGISKMALYHRYRKGDRGEKLIRPLRRQKNRYGKAPQLTKKFVHANAGVNGLGYHPNQSTADATQFYQLMQVFKTRTNDFYLQGNGYD